MVVNSALYDCVIRHQRLSPAGYKFAHNIFMFFIDLDELDDLNRNSFIVGYERSRLYSLRDDDHMPGYDGNLRQKVEHYLATASTNKEQSVPGLLAADLGKIFLLTNLRVFGYVFNPVSFFFCLNKNGQQICSIAEVGNTFSEKKLYFLPVVEDKKFAARLPKEFYVSPFSQLHLDFDFQIKSPDALLQIDINEFELEKPVLFSSVTGERREFCDAQVIALTAKYPLVTLRIIFLIHWHAFMLLLKSMPFYAKHKDAHLQKNVLNRHPCTNESRAILRKQTK